MAGEHIRKQIINKIKRAKYFFIILDTTPDKSHTERRKRNSYLKLFFRYLHINENGICSIEESFIDFINAKMKTGEYLTQVIEFKLSKDGLNIADIREQAYDNGSNMAGHFKGVQARILQKNSFASFLLCAAHSLNLIA